MTTASTRNDQARAEIMARIRSSLSDVPDTPPEQDTPVAWTYHAATRPDLDHAGVIDLFVERVEDYRATVVRCRTAEVPDRIAAALREHGARSVVVPAGLDGGWVAALGEFEVRRDEPRLSRAQLNETDAVVTASAVSAAESGTIVLDHRQDQGRRALSLVPDLHVCVVRSDQVVTDVPEAVARLAPSVRDEHLPLTWISGGSATSDIELSRVEGVHGPRTLVVVLTQD
ncbi:MAG: LUD domain-containing protein [Actinobacteria bacterium]|nr:LUD domain-containing protein [Actinomycetota bacterium]